ncbi:hypothetical protein OHA71_02440 [Streptomyces sp. NBC_00444]|uniref:hypothetical protein n=1 Tax=Streptomyces sp. NBC_00444 TaxID=2975744 RepID=UPI002E1D368C
MTDESNEAEPAVPDVYGRSRNAFRDAITGLVDLPHELTFTGWAAFSAALPAEASLSLRRIHYHGD